MKKEINIKTPDVNSKEYENYLKNRKMKKVERKLRHGDDVFINTYKNEGTGGKVRLDIGSGYIDYEDEDEDPNKNKILEAKLLITKLLYNLNQSFGIDMGFYEINNKNIDKDELSESELNEFKNLLFKNNSLIDMNINFSITNIDIKEEPETFEEYKKRIAREEKRKQNKKLQKEKEDKQLEAYVKKNKNKIETVLKNLKKISK